MKMPAWLVPAAIVAFLVVRIAIGVRMGARVRKETGRSLIQSVPVWIRAFWVLLALATAALLIWSPRKQAPALTDSPPPSQPR
jgi:protein-S-isoprenylcysteine O-methyltransferase Ste14